MAVHAFATAGPGRSFTATAAEVPVRWKPGSAEHAAVLIGTGFRCRSARQNFDLQSFAGVPGRRFFTCIAPKSGDL